MTALTTAQLGCVLIAMAGKAKDRAEQCGRMRSAQDNPSALLHHLSIILQHGAEECIRIVEDNASDD